MRRLPRSPVKLDDVRDRVGQQRAIVGSDHDGAAVVGDQPRQPS
jgi:hypothetical protein